MAYQSLDEINGKVLALVAALRTAMEKDTSKKPPAEKAKPQQDALLKYLDAAAKGAVNNIQQLTNLLKGLFTQSKTVFGRMEAVVKRMKGATSYSPAEAKADMEALKTMQKTLVGFEQNTSRTLADFEAAEQGYNSGDWIPTLENFKAKTTLVMDDGSLKPNQEVKVEEIRNKGKACRLMAGRITSTLVKLSGVEGRIKDYVVRGEKMQAEVKRLAAGVEKDVAMEMKLITKALAQATDLQTKFWNAVLKYDDDFKKVWVPISRKAPKEYKLKDVNDLKTLKRVMDSEKKKVDGTVKSFQDVDVEDQLKKLKEVSGGAMTSAQADLQKKLLKVQTDFKKLLAKWEDSAAELVQDCVELLKVVEKHSKENAEKAKVR